VGVPWVDLGLSSSVINHLAWCCLSPEGKQVKVSVRAAAAWAEEIGTGSQSTKSTSRS